MKQETHTKSLPSIPGARIAILQSAWYSEHTTNMVHACVKILKEASVQEVDLYRLPGAFELPLAARAVLRKAPFDAVILFGAIIKGETFHFEMLLEGLSQGITRVMFEENVPVINEVIPATTLAQIVDRSGEDQFNKGIEAAKAAIETIFWRRTMTPFKLV
jgi:6,7-dimethyl-8-ribityllumazine synthase